MRFFRDQPIRMKIMMILTIVVGVALVLQRVVLYYIDLSESRNAIRAEMVSMAEIIGGNSEAALVFKDPKAGISTLESLKLNPVILTAAIYDKSGALFAKYRGENRETEAAPRIHPDGHTFAADQFELYHPIVLDDKRIGTIYLLADLNPMHQRLNRNNVIAFGILLLAFLVAIGLSSILQRVISRPILEMANTARAISEKKDYSLRATPEGSDEIGRMIEGFNHMLSQIQARDAALRESQQRVTLLVQETPLGVIIWDTDFKVIEWNKAAEHIFGFTEAEALGQHAHFIVSDSAWNQGVQDVQEGLLARSGGWRSMNENIRRDGTPIFCDWYNTSLVDPAGNVFGVASLVDDISDRKRAEAEVQKLNTELEQRVRERTSQLEAANKELEAFAYSVSHDLRAPLRAIDGFSQIIQGEYGNRLDERGGDYLRRVREATQRMGQLIDDMLTLSRVTRTEMKREPVDLSVMVTTLADEFRQREPQRNLCFDIEPHIVARGDPRLLRIMLENLVGNAWKFTSKQPQARIEFGAKHDSDPRVYYIRDNGAGFDMTYVTRLFSAFQRLHTTSEFPGTGVGLAIVQRIVLRHSGCVSAEGEVDKGSTFSFTLGADHG